ncbi:MAG: hypothetical protein CL569_09995 [Alphaproteobacteria bacterium]|nr:hypothetical protein [Alphaproteobacteria bacterium]
MATGCGRAGCILKIIFIVEIGSPSGPTRFRAGLRFDTPSVQVRYVFGFRVAVDERIGGRACIRVITLAHDANGIVLTRGEQFSRLADRRIFVVLAILLGVNPAASLQLVEVV